MSFLSLWQELWTRMSQNTVKIMSTKKTQEDANINHSEQELNEEVSQNTESPEVEINLELLLQEEKDKYLRLFAEFENFRKRNAKERIELLQTAGKEVIQDLLPVLDDFNRAMKANADSLDTYKEGIELVIRKLNGTMESKGLKKMNCLGEAFNPDLHEAITQIPVEDEKMKGCIVDVVEDGYTLNDRVIRFAKVIIGQS